MKELILNMRALPEYSGFVTSNVCPSRRFLHAMGNNHDPMRLEHASYFLQLALAALDGCQDGITD